MLERPWVRILALYTGCVDGIFSNGFVVKKCKIGNNYDWFFFNATVLLYTENTHCSMGSLTVQMVCSFTGAGSTKQSNMLIFVKCKTIESKSVK